MRRKNTAKKFLSETRILFWPSFVDMLITTLMVVLLVYFLQTVFNIGDLEAMKIQQEQNEFVNRFRKTFSSEIARERIRINPGLNFIQITFSNEVLFTSGEYQLQPQGREILQRVAELFKNSTNYNFKQIQVEGHTDNEPISNPYKYPHDNWELSAGRSISVVKFLLDDNGLGNKFKDKVIISANGYSEFCPIASNETLEGKADNRRIEFLIIFSTPQKNALNNKK